MKSELAVITLASFLSSDSRKFTVNSFTDEGSGNSKLNVTQRIDLGSSVPAALRHMDVVMKGHSVHQITVLK